MPLSWETEHPHGCAEKKEPWLYLDPSPAAHRPSLLLNFFSKGKDDAELLTGGGISSYTLYAL